MDCNRISTNNTFTKGLVSIITPCYNTEKFIHRLMDSILMQSYPSIEMFAINDGSTDNTLNVLESYVDRFQSKGYSLTIITQENQGQSFAINYGLKLIHGEFLVWPDSDDFYSSEYAIEKMATELKNSDDTIGMVRVQENIVDENDLHILSINGKSNKRIEDINLFEECLYAKNRFYFPPGGYMIKSQILKDEVNLDIYTEKKAGQNWQIYLPILINHRCLSILEPLYTVLSRNTSHSRGQFKKYNDLKELMTSYENTIINTLLRIKNIDETSRQKYVKNIQVKYSVDRYLLSLKYFEKKDINEGKDTLIKWNAFNLCLRCIYIISNIPCLNKITPILCKIYRKIWF